MQSQKNKTFRSIKTKLTAALVLLSLVLTSFIVFLNFYIEYKNNLTLLDHKLQQINESSVPSIASGAWNLDLSYLTEQTESIAKIQDIVEVRIFDSDNKLIVERFHESVPALVASDFKFYHYPLYHFNKALNSNEYLGKVAITATTQHIKASLISRIKIIVMAEVVKTFLITWLILLIIHFYINKNIEKIIQFTNKFDPNLTESNYLSLGRNISHRDEMDILQDAINRMIQQLVILNKEKETRISEQERKIEIQQAAAITSAKMAALGTMAGGIAHEINNPLSIIHTHAKLMEKMIDKGVTDPVVFSKYLKTINKTIDRIVSIITGLKNISRTAPDTKNDRVTLKDILVDILSLCEERFKQSEIKIICNLDESAFSLLFNCNRVQLSQVFLNLFNNSFDALEDLSEKWIKIDAKTESDGTKNWLVIYFIDSGRGIPKEIRENIFQPFYTTKEVGKGTGLGLSLIYAMIKNHNGEIFFNENYENTCFTIKLAI